MSVPVQSDPDCAATDTITLLGGRVTLRIPRDQGLKPSIDTVLLAASVPAKPHDHVLDGGCGVGAASLCLAARIESLSITGIERVPVLVDYARINADLNNDASFARFECADLFDPALKSFYNRFDHVMCNPPYMDGPEHCESPDGLRDQALSGQNSHETVEGWCQTLVRFVKPRGTLTLIQRADRVHRILGALAPTCGALEIIPLWPREGVAARRVIVRGIKGRATPATLHPGLVLHHPDGSYTDRTDGILTRMHGLFTETGKTAATNK